MLYLPRQGGGCRSKESHRPDQPMVVSGVGCPGFPLGILHLGGQCEHSVLKFTVQEAKKVLHQENIPVGWTLRKGRGGAMRTEERPTGTNTGLITPFGVAFKISNNWIGV